MDYPSALQAGETPATHASIDAITAEISTYAGAAPADTVATSPSAKSNWIKSAVHLSRHKQRHIGDGEFSRYDLGEIRKDYVPPVYLTIGEPEPPLLKPRNRKGPNPHIMAAKAWYREWAHRDWDAAKDFFAASEIDEEINHPVVRLAD